MVFAGPLFATWPWLVFIKSRKCFCLKLCTCSAFALDLTLKAFHDLRADKLWDNYLCFFNKAGFSPTTENGFWACFLRHGKLDVTLFIIRLQKLPISHLIIHLERLVRSLQKIIYTKSNSMNNAFRKWNTWYTDFLCCVSVVVDPQWRHAYCWTGRRDVMAPSAKRIVRNSRIKRVISERAETHSRWSLARKPHSCDFIIVWDIMIIGGRFLFGHPIRNRNRYWVDWGESNLNQTYL
jgi:hypothetical protein